MKSGWSVKKIRAIASINPRHDKTTPDNTSVSFVPMPVVNTNGPDLLPHQPRPLGEVRKGYTHFRDGDVLLAKITPCMENGKAAIARNLVNGLGCGTTELHVLRPSSSILPEWLYFFVWQESFRKEAEQNMTGTAGQLRVPLAFVENHEIPIPPSIEEQKRITKRLNQIAGRLEEIKSRLNAVPTLLKRFRQSVLAAACSGICFRRKPTILALQDVVQSIRTGPFGSTLHKADYVRGGTPIINPMHIISGQIVPTENMTVDKNTAKRLEEFRLLTGDVVLARRGEMGRCAVVGKHQEGWLCGTGSMIVRPNSKMNSDFLQLFLSTPNTVMLLENASVGTTMANLNQRVLLSLELECPDLEDQKEIMGRVSLLLQQAAIIETRYKKAMAFVEKIMSSILAKAFRGEL